MMSHDQPTGPGTLLTSRFTRAVDVARVLHGAECRKQTPVTYVCHLLAVAALVLEHGGTEDQAIAALLHDAAEDHGGAARLRMIEAEFGPAVAHLVEACSDSLVADRSDKAPWPERKTAYLVRLEGEPPEAALVSTADKLHNARTVLADYREVGEALWGRFNAAAGRDGSVWYYVRMAEILRGRLAGADPLARRLSAELDRTVDDLVAAVATAVPTIHDEIDARRGEEQRLRALLPRSGGRSSTKPDGTPPDRDAERGG
jgi:hypothetical protein